jgi:hypothetical protein
MNGFKLQRLGMIMEPEPAAGREGELFADWDCARAVQ